MRAMLLVPRAISLRAWALRGGLFISPAGCGVLSSKPAVACSLETRLLTPRALGFSSMGGVSKMRRAGGGRRESCFPSLRKGVLFEDLFPSLWMKQETVENPWLLEHSLGS